MSTRANHRCSRGCPGGRRNTASCATLDVFSRSNQALKSRSWNRSQPSNRYSKYESTGGCTDAVGSTQAPVSMFSVVPTRLSGERRSNTALDAFFAAW